MITNYITIMFYDLCYYILLPLVCATGAAGLYYMRDPVGAKNKAINLSWDITKCYITWSDKFGLFIDKYTPEKSESDDDFDDSDDDSDLSPQYFIFYNNEHQNIYITDEINDEIMEHVNAKIKPSIMFIRSKIGREQYYKRTHIPMESDTVYDTLVEKLFIQVEYVTKDDNGKENVTDIHSNLNGFYVNGNTILDKKFLQWYLGQYYNIDKMDDYELRIFDKDVNMLTIKSTQAVKIEDNTYSIIESSTIEESSTVEKSETMEDDDKHTSDSDAE
jgi:hypothetical protein